MPLTNPHPQPSTHTKQQQQQHPQASHPCLLSHFDAFEARLRGRRLAVFLDYDGTLTPIVRDPDAAVMSEAMRDAVRRVARLFPTAIISGRGREKVEAFVRLPELFYAGSHGMDIAGPRRRAGGSSGSGGGGSGGGCGECSGGGSDPQQQEQQQQQNQQQQNQQQQEQQQQQQQEQQQQQHHCARCGGPQQFRFQAAAEYQPLIDAAYAQLRERLAGVPGASVEHNKFCVSAHFRNCHPDSWQRVVAAVDGAVAACGGGRLHVTRGRKVLEVRPAVDWDKGSALLHLLDALGLSGQPDVTAVYLGDDKTDEDAFAALAGAGAGAGVLVSTVAKPTAAAFTLRDPDEVLELLRRLLAYGAGAGNGWRAPGAACNGWAPAAGGEEGEGNGAQQQQQQQPPLQEQQQQPAPKQQQQQQQHALPPKPQAAAARAAQQQQQQPHHRPLAEGSERNVPPPPQPPQPQVAAGGDG